VGGLHIIGTERHEARRIDNQLRGRAGRQGDPGSSQFFLSLEDDIMRIFGGDRIKSLMGLLKIPEDQPIENKMISGAIESAQSKIEGMNFDLRKHILEYDDVMNKHREVIYNKRKDFLIKAQQGGLRTEVLAIIKKTGGAEEDYQKREKEIGEESMRQIEKAVCLRVLDMFWMNHLEEMEILRDSVRLRAYGQQDPLVEYKSEGHRMFQRLLAAIESTIATTVLKANITRGPSLQTQPAQQNKKEISRNDPCPCGAKHPDGRPIKYKHCHGK
jgi:preprotein translocase subunit SecA